VVADRSAQHRVAALQSVENRALRRLTCNVQLYLAFKVRKCPQMRRESDADHGRV
jgi:hypothetical protein